MRADLYLRHPTESTIKITSYNYLRPGDSVRIKFGQEEPLSNNFDEYTLRQLRFLENETLHSRHAASRSINFGRNRN